ncbi:hypothetical protein T4B_7927 [Trichinella pseudospiralis]|uniref:Uncharacterized protein n=2 Tax=Trichinella pseudospiralis TaxID=6337 RepID=A0A0V1EFH3_TRIPS|nr:hypothetical protein T4A_1931 [Trichinella pseudospiralis]KRY85188.1 hypothetical protein T4D_7742 [Trichinella pseudospiralis]KRZ23126.1 hypothetical protein T4B_7927 [Trichinella pseudospiralis]
MLEYTDLSIQVNRPCDHWFSWLFCVLLFAMIRILLIADLFTLKMATANVEVPNAHGRKSQLNDRYLLKLLQIIKSHKTDSFQTIAGEMCATNERCGISTRKRNEHP